jgi:hypothetical protein
MLLLLTLSRHPQNGLSFEVCSFVFVDTLGMPQSLSSIADVAAMALEKQ